MKCLVLIAVLVPLCLCASYAALEEDAALPYMPSTMTSIVKPNTTTSHPTTTTRVTNATAQTTRVTNVTAQTTRVTNTTATNLSTTHVLTTVPPTLTPNFSLPETGQYNVSIKNAICIKATLGIQLFVKEHTEDFYFNIPPAKTVASGKCGNLASWIILKFNSGFVNFTFVNDGKHYYVSEISVALNTMKNLEKNYLGTVKNIKLFKTTLGHSYKCKSKQVVDISANSLWILIVNTQLQAFDITGGKFGKVAKCEMDAESKLIPALVGIALTGLILTVIIIYTIDRRQKFQEYEAIKG
ncbi:lysosome-associated membrane glycoprotein 3 isoform X1 [Chiloscyllium plagiosum]|uniref:lysosome-associated membrane glycoprotein 3 isoform X1 n=1 Tax=Chiloscyllium plagiosum TaxID=36176 RepID=UPI001CB82DF0|nr:lysosome-associated membrane glycoprotein 3 isoform X1 [Chiloscyllium plagiosum]